MREIWKDIKGYEGLYEISDSGRIRNSRGKILKQSIGTSGYYTTHLYNHTKRQTVMAHRLVAKTFVPNPENKREVNHINGNKTDNRAQNLEWVTPRENITHSYANSLKKTRKINQYDLTHNLIREWEGMAIASRQLHIDRLVMPFLL